MRTKRQIEATIARLRTRHTELFNSDNPTKFDMMFAVSRKIREEWAAWHRLDEKEKEQNAV